MAKEHKFKFAKKEYTQKGKISAALAGISLGLFVVACILSFALSGKAGIYVGGIALMAMLFSVYGFYEGLSGYSDKQGSHIFCTAGAIGNGVLMVVWLALFLIGV